MGHLADKQCKQVMYLGGAPLALTLWLEGNKFLFLMKMLKSRAKAHVKRAQELMVSFGHSDEKDTEQLMAFGGRKRRKKVYTSPDIKNTREQDLDLLFYYLHYTKEEVLHRIAGLHKKFEMEHIHCLLLLILHGAGTVYDTSVPMSASDMLLIFNLSFVFDFLKHNDYTTIDSGNDWHLSKALELVKKLNLQWYLLFLKAGGTYEFVENVLFFHSEDSQSLHNYNWHFDGKPGFRVSDVFFFACTPEPKSGCGTRICNLPDTFDYPQNWNDFVGADAVRFLEKECKVLPTEHLHSINLSSTSKKLHRGLLPDEIKNTTRLFYAFEEKYRGVFERVVRDMDIEMKKCNGLPLVLSHVPQSAHRKLDSLVFDLISAKRVQHSNTY